MIINRNIPAFVGALVVGKLVWMAVHHVSIHMIGGF